MWLLCLVVAEEMFLFAFDTITRVLLTSKASNSDCLVVVEGNSAHLLL